MTNTEGVFAAACMNMSIAKRSPVPEQAAWPQRRAIAGACEGNETRQLALDLAFIPVVPPLKIRIEPWQYDREMHKLRNEVERPFRRLKGHRRIFSCFEKLDVMFVGFISFAPIADGLHLC